jgi:glycosyltransferase involved in cell wall biosynthesis
MRILFVINNLNMGGKERQLVELLNILSQNTSHMFGVCLREDVIQFNVSNVNNIIIYKPSKRLSFLSLILFQQKVISLFQPDIIHAWEGSVALASSILKLLIYRSIPIIDGTIRYSKIYNVGIIDKFTMNFTRTMSTMVVANSNAGLDSVNGLNKRNYLVIPNGIDLKRLYLLSINEKNNGDKVTVIGMVANFVKPKDYYTVIKAGLELILEEESIHFIFIGDGPEKSYMESVIPARFKDKFLFIGYTQNPENYIKRFDIGVLLNKKGYSEGMSNSIMEYMAFKLPVICTKAGGNNELITDNFNGYLVQNEDCNDFKRVLKKLIDDKELRKIFGNRSYNILLNKYDLKVIANKYLDLYSKIITRN